MKKLFSLLILAGVGGGVAYALKLYGENQQQTNATLEQAIKNQQEQQKERYPVGSPQNPGAIKAALVGPDTKVVHANLPDFSGNSKILCYSDELSGWGYVRGNDFMFNASDRSPRDPKRVCAGDAYLAAIGEGFSSPADENMWNRYKGVL